MITKRTGTFAVLAATLTALLTSDNLVLGKGKPGGNTPTPPPVAFSVALLPDTLGKLRVSKMNIDGDIVGFSYVDGQLAETKRPFVYYAASGALIDLNDLLAVDTDWVLIEARDINNSGQIVGWGYVADDEEKHAFRFTPSSDGVQPGTVEDIGTTDPDHVASDAYAINNLGDVALRVLNTNGPVYVSVWQEGVDEDALPVLADTGIGSAYPDAINDLGQIVAFYSGQDHYCFRYTPGVGIETFLSSTEGASPMEVKDINNWGQVVGGTGFYVEGKGKRFRAGVGRYTDGVGIEDVGIDGGPLTGGGWAINSDGDCIGYDIDNESHLFLDETGISFSLRTAVTQSDDVSDLQTWENAGGILVQDLNDGRQICGRLENPDGTVGRAFLLTPLNE